MSGFLEEEADKLDAISPQPPLLQLPDRVRNYILQFTFNGAQRMYFLYAGTRDLQLQIMHMANCVIEVPGGSPSDHFVKKNRWGLQHVHDQAEMIEIIGREHNWLGKP